MKPPIDSFIRKPYPTQPGQKRTRAHEEIVYELREDGLWFVYEDGTECHFNSQSPGRLWDQERFNNQRKTFREHGVLEEFTE